MVKKLLAFCSLFFFVSGFSQNFTASENTAVSILTVGTADASHSLYGHTALRIKDAQTGLDVVYNYGMFDFATPNFMLKFVKGDLQYFAAAYPYADFEYNYRVENRSIYEQVLNLSVAEKQTLLTRLNSSLASEDNYYTYKFIDRNCTTKVIDIVNEVLEGAPIQKRNIKEESYRDVLYPYVDHHFYQKLGINIIFGHRVDNQATQIFLPFDLHENLELTSYKNQPLVTTSTTIFEANRIQPFSFVDSIYSLVLLLLIIVLVNKKWLNTVYFLVMGSIGLLFSVIGSYSLHQEVLWNYNELLFNPLLLLLVYFLIARKENAIRITAWIIFGLLIVYCIYMLNKVHLPIVLPIVFTTFVLLLRELFPQKWIIGRGKTKPYYRS